uniref:Uncharacterized protein n=1 Tax=Anguilla anguilla TaxID=7936 RepID=A0A0E9S6M9_ANGAN
MSPPAGQKKTAPTGRKRKQRSSFKREHFQPDENDDTRYIFLSHKYLISYFYYYYSKFHSLNIRMSIKIQKYNHQSHSKAVLTKCTVRAGNK